MTIILPVHLRTRLRLLEMKENFLNSNVKIIKSISSFDMFFLEKNADLIITNSGGV